jgi:hypothetical protein
MIENIALYGSVFWLWSLYPRALLTINRPNENKVIRFIAFFFFAFAILIRPVFIAIVLSYFFPFDFQKTLIIINFLVFLLYYFTYDNNND